MPLSVASTPSNCSGRDGHLGAEGQEAFGRGAGNTAGDAGDYHTLAGEVRGQVVSHVRAPFCVEEALEKAFNLYFQNRHIRLLYMTERNIDRGTAHKLEYLPLLLSLKAVVDEGSVVQAADKLGITQSAVSKHLAKLRHWLGDPLFVRTSSGLQPTPRALAAQEPINAVLHAADQLLEVATVTPASFTGEFRISATDEVLGRLLPELLERVTAEAPRLRLTTLPLAVDYSLHDLETGRVDLLIAVNWHAPESLKQRRAFSDRFVCLMHKDHELVPQKLTAKRYAGARHVLVAPLAMTRGVLDAVLAEQGLTRQIVASVPSFALLTPKLLGKTCVATVPLQVAREVADGAPMVVRELPFRSPPIDYYVLWHPRFDQDPRLGWVRKHVEQLLGVPKGAGAITRNHGRARRRGDC